MCPIKKKMMSSGSRPLCNSSLSEHHQTVWTAPPKKPAGWTKFRETRHPVFRGVRRRGNAGPVQLLAMRPASYRSLDDVRRAVAEAVEGFQRREARADEDRKPSSSANSCNGGDDSTDGEESSPAAKDDAVFELDVFNDMSWDLYYASLAQGMLMEPPCAVAAFGDDGEAHIADVSLWSY
jgi:hypothetical protein